jgi:hypothetical protein
MPFDAAAEVENWWNKNAGNRGNEALAGSPCGGVI